MKIYTKSGDSGETSTFKGKRLPKTSLVIKANGNIDELNSFIGLLISRLEYGKIKESLLRVQNDLFDFGADVSLTGTLIESKTQFKINSEQTQKLEEEIDEWDQNLPQLKNFILPGGSFEGGLAHVARSVCRRAERELIALSHVEKINQELLSYINRLSDWLFVLARTINKSQDTLETKYVGNRGSN